MLIEDSWTKRLQISAERGIITDWQDAWLLGTYIGQTGQRGITQDHDGKYFARVNCDGVQHYVGRFTTIEEATTARNAWLSNEMENFHG